MLTGCNFSLSFFVSRVVILCTWFILFFYIQVFYGTLLATSAKFISDGAEMLLAFGLSPSVIGGVVLPVLGAVPDCAIIIGYNYNIYDKLDRVSRTGFLDQFYLIIKFHKFISNIFLKLAKKI